MEAAVPNGSHMSMEMFVKALDFIDRNKFMFVMLSGGEPTDHPQFCEFVKTAKAKLGSEPLRVLVLSNGLFWANERRREEYLALNVNFQIINDPEYYPIRVDRIDHPRVLYDDKIMAPITPLGRAITLSRKPKASRMSPLCFNLRSATRQLKDFQKAVLLLRQAGKMCTPSIKEDGAIVAGESCFCHYLGHVESSNVELTNRVMDMKCNVCGLVDNLTPEFKKIIGE
jgi:hypothetical protein